MPDKLSNKKHKDRILCLLQEKEINEAANELSDYLDRNPQFEGNEEVLALYMMFEHIRSQAIKRLREIIINLPTS